MKESEEVMKECEQIYLNYCNCVKELNFLGRLFNQCDDLVRKFRKCRIRQFELQRKEHNEASGFKKLRD